MERILLRAVVFTTNERDTIARWQQRAVPIYGWACEMMRFGGEPTRITGSAFNETGISLTDIDAYTQAMPFIKAYVSLFVGKPLLTEVGLRLVGHYPRAKALCVTRYALTSSGA